MYSNFIIIFFKSPSPTPLFSFACSIYCLFSHCRKSRTKLSHTSLSFSTNLCSSRKLLQVFHPIPTGAAVCLYCFSSCTKAAGNQQTKIKALLGFPLKTSLCFFLTFMSQATRRLIEITLSVTTLHLQSLNSHELPLSKTPIITQTENCWCKLEELRGKKRNLMTTQSQTATVIFSFPLHFVCYFQRQLQWTSA